LSIESQCEKVQRLAAELTQVDALQEFTFRDPEPLALQLARKYQLPPSCPVPAGIIKAVEVAAWLALPADAAIRISEDEHEISSN
jgi:hypothetical protein